MVWTAFCLLSQTSRFQPSAPFKNLPPITVDTYLSRNYPAQELATSKHWQARMLWVDGTANLDRVSSTEKVEALVSKAAQVGFNVVVFDVKPISGQTLYPSRLTQKITSWRGQHLPASFDPLAAMVAACHANKINLYISLNAFSEGHNLMKVGPGYYWPERQSVFYEGEPIVRFSGGDLPLNKEANVAAKTGAATFTKLPSTEQRKGIRFMISVNQDGTMVDGFEPAAPNLTMPKGGFCIAAFDPSSEKILKTLARPGQSVELAIEDSYKRSGEKPEAQYPLMMNPGDLDNQDRALEFIREIATQYAIDGMVYDDRLRYAGIYADFSPSTLEEFTHYVKRSVEQADIFRFTLNPNMSRGIKPGPLYDTWMQWRAQKLNHYVRKARGMFKNYRPNGKFGIYAGSWYGEYPALGMNYGADSFDAGFWFLTPEYASTGVAKELDFLVGGCYYRVPTIYAALEKGAGIGGTVEASAMLMGRALDSQSWLVAGLQLNQFGGSTKDLAAALQAAAAASQGVMVFDVSHGIEGFWDTFAAAFEARPKAIFGPVSDLRRVPKKQKPTVIIAAGSAGTGQ